MTNILYTIISKNASTLNDLFIFFICIVKITKTLYNIIIYYIGSDFLKNSKNKKLKLKLNTKPEKITATIALSAASAIIFDQKKKKIKHPKKYQNFLQRTIKNYKIIDALLTKTIAKDTSKKAKEQFKSKSLNSLEIENGEFIDI